MISPNSVFKLHVGGLTGRSISRSVMLNFIEHFDEFLKEWVNDNDR